MAVRTSFRLSRLPKNTTSIPYGYTPRTSRGGDSPWFEQQTHLEGQTRTQGNQYVQRMQGNQYGSNSSPVKAPECASRQYRRYSVAATGATPNTATTAGSYMF